MEVVAVAARGGRRAGDGVPGGAVAPGGHLQGRHFELLTT